MFEDQQQATMKLDAKSFGCGLAVGAVGMLVIGVVVVLVTATVMLKRQTEASDSQKSPASAFCPLAGDEALTTLLKPIRQKFGLPAMAAAVVTSGGIQFV